MDIRIDPEVSTISIDRVAVRVLAVHLGGTPRGAAVVLAGPDGLDELRAVDVMNLLAQHGYESVLATPDPSTPVDLGFAVVRRLVDLMEAHGWTREQIAVIGYGEGASAAFLTGTRSAFGAVVSVPCETRDLLDTAYNGHVRSPWLGLVGCGLNDELATEIRFCRDTIWRTAVEHLDLVGYSGIEHCLRDSTEALTHAAVFDAWQRTVEWLNIHVVPRPTPAAEAWRKRRLSLQSIQN